MADVGQLIFDARRNLRVDGAADEALLLECLELGRECCICYIWHQLLQLAEAERVAVEIVQNDDRPLALQKTLGCDVGAFAEFLKILFCHNKTPMRFVKIPQIKAPQGGLPVSKRSAGKCFLLYNAQGLKKHAAAVFVNFS